MATFAVYESPEDEQAFEKLDEFDQYADASSFSNDRKRENYENDRPDNDLRIVAFADSDDIPAAYIHETPLNAAVRRNNDLYPRRF